MSSTLKNILIFVVIGAALFFAYVFFFPKNSEQTSLVISPNGSSTTSPSAANSPASGQNAQNPNGDLLPLLLSIKSISLDVSIFSDKAFSSLHDSSIEITKDIEEGRSNPFAPVDKSALSPQVDNSTSASITNNLGNLGTIGASSPTGASDISATPDSGTSTSTNGTKNTLKTSGTSTNKTGGTSTKTKKSSTQ